MRRLRALLRLRKESDKVKLALWLFLLAAVLAGKTAVTAGSYVSQIQSPVEYVLTSGEVGAALDGKMQVILQNANVMGATRQREYALTDGERSLMVTEVSGQYLADCFGLAESGSGTQVYLGRKVFYSFFGNGAQSPVRASVQTGEGQTVSGAFTLAEELPENLAITKGTTLTLGGSLNLRVMLAGTDISGGAVSQLEGLGLTVTNRETVLIAEYENQLLLTRLSYGILSCILAAIAGCTLFAAGRGETSRRPL